MNNTWTRQQAINLCRQIEGVCTTYGCHVALTGGLLYKDGERKDCDILFYRIRQSKTIDKVGLLIALAKLGVTVVSGVGWIRKAVFDGRTLDIFFPEEPSASDKVNVDSAGVVEDAILA